MEELNLSNPHPSGGAVKLNKDRTLSWPVMFLYPEFGQSDYVKAFHERDWWVWLVEGLVGVVG